MWENRSETLKEYTYNLILKRRKNARVERKICEKTIENPPVVHYAYGQVFIRQAWCTDRPHSFCEF
jgi:hypothetical protein